MSIVDCVNHAFHPSLSSGPRPVLNAKSQPQHASVKVPQFGEDSLTGAPLLSQGDFCVTGPAMVTDVPITYLGYVHRDTGVVEETGHPLDGQSTREFNSHLPQRFWLYCCPVCFDGFVVYR